MQGGIIEYLSSNSQPFPDFPSFGSCIPFDKLRDDDEYCEFEGSYFGMLTLTYKDTLPLEIFVLSMFFDLFIFLLTVHKTYRRGKEEPLTPLFTLLARDGRIYFLYVVR